MCRKQVNLKVTAIVRALRLRKQRVRRHPTSYPALGPIARYLVRVGGSKIIRLAGMHLATHVHSSCVSEIKALAHRPLE